ncbi:MAG: hypothetical protein ACTHMY_13840 [Solirubrobacteraceae bacterium]
MNLTVAPDFHPHELPTHEPWATTDAVSMSLVLARYLAAYTCRVQHRAEWPLVDGLFYLVRSLD